MMSAIAMTKDRSAYRQTRARRGQPWAVRTLIVASVFIGARDARAAIIPVTRTRTENQQPGRMFAAGSHLLGQLRYQRGDFRI